jgi:hypothetical protein
MQRASTLVSLVAAVSGVILLGCGQPTEFGRQMQGDPVPSLANTYTRTTDAKSARMTVTEHGTVGRKTFGSSAQGVIDFKARTAEYTWSFTEPPLPGTLEVRLIDEYMYQKAPAGFSPRGRPWQKIDLRGIGLSGPNQPSTGQDSIRSLSYLRGLSRSATVIGSEDIRGVQTTHYRADVDLAVARSQAINSDDTTSAASLGQLRSKLGTSTFPADVYLDDQGRVRRIAYELSRRHRGGDRIRITMEFFDFGIPVAVTAPPTDETFEQAQGPDQRGVAGSGA